MMPRKLGLQCFLRQTAQKAAVAGATWQQPATPRQKRFWSSYDASQDHSSGFAQILQTHDTFPESLQCRRKTVKDQYILLQKVSRDTRANMRLAIIF